MEIVVPLDVAQAMLDIATESLDFGSGFLDDAEVESLRAFAVLIGVDPMDATPDNHKPKYCPEHVWRDLDKPDWGNITQWNSRVCTFCQKREYTRG